MAMILVTHDLGVVAGRTDETLVRCAEDRCVEEEPPLTNDEGSTTGHVYACWFPVGFGRVPASTSIGHGVDPQVDPRKVSP